MKPVMEDAASTAQHGSPARSVPQPGGSVSETSCSPPKSEALSAADVEAKGASPSQELPAQAGPLGAALEPILQRACEGRLSRVTWFRTDWQRGGAATGYATFADNGDAPQPAVVKLPVPPRERQWLVRLQQAEDVAPRVYAHGESLNGYDLAWVVMERLPHGPLTVAWQGVEFDLVVDAIGRFYAAAASVPLTGEPPRRNWQGLYERARQRVASRAVPEAQRWKNALKKANRSLDGWIDTWESRPINGWCHGDLHLANAMTRTAAPEGPAVLLDFAEVEPGHWLEDAIYFEHLYWGAKDRLAGRKLTKAIARRRRDLGLEVESDWADLAQVKRSLLATITPALLDAKGDACHVHAALEVLEREVG